MNYLLVCCLLVLFPLNLSWEILYIIKMLGFVFAILSTKEIFEVITIKAQKKGLKKPPEKYIVQKDKTKSAVWIIGVVFFVCMTLKGIFTGVGVSKSLDNILSAIMGTIVTFCSVILVKMLFEFSKCFGKSYDADKTEDNSPFYYKILKTEGVFTKFVVFTSINIIADLLNRFVRVNSIQAYSGVVEVISKIVLLVMLIVLMVSINKLRSEADSEIS